MFFNYFEIRHEASDLFCGLGQFYDGSVVINTIQA